MASFALKAATKAPPGAALAPENHHVWVRLVEVVVECRKLEVFHLYLYSARPSPSRERHQRRGAPTSVTGKEGVRPLRRGSFARAEKTKRAESPTVFTGLPRR
jgi:hypothetical protein